MINCVADPAKCLEQTPLGSSSPFTYAIIRDKMNEKVPICATSMISITIPAAIVP